MDAVVLQLVKDAEGTFHLTSIKPKEVSVVDRSANRKKWLLAKSEEDVMPGAALTETTDGSLTLKTEGAGAEASTTQDGDAATGGAADAAAGGVVKLDLPAEKKAELQPLAHKLVEQALHLHNSIVEAKEVKEGGEIPKAMLDEAQGIKAAVEALDKAINPQADDASTPSETAGEAQVEEGGGELVCDKCGATSSKGKAGDQCPACKAGKLIVKPAKAAKTDTAAEAVDKKKGDAPAHEKMMDEQAAAIEKVLGELRGKVAEMDPKDLRTKLSQIREITWKLEETATVVNVGKAADGITEEDLAAMAEGNLPERLAKVGRRMSGKNLTAFQGALEKIRGEMEKLFNLWRALLPEEQQKEADAIRKRVVEDMGLPEIPEDNAGGSFTWPESGAGEMPDAAQPGPIKDTLETLQKQLTSKQGEVVTLRKALEVARLREEAVEPPSSSDLEVQRVQKNAQAEDWPLDMNAPAYRERVEKGETT